MHSSLLCGMCSSACGYCFLKCACLCVGITQNFRHAFKLPLWDVQLCVWVSSFENVCFFMCKYYTTTLDTYLNLG